ncbi:CBS domain protein [hydrothermal vent metagenome]|uniref:CBS domain protein n=1 Tax=hydrothermal vent metagenome TaxID=652676 RepID=A0A3B0ZGA8_9ZZZZ
MTIDTIMSRKIVTVEMDDPLKAVKDIFDHVHFHHLLVIEHHKLVGVISDRDLLRAISPNIGTNSETEHDTHTLNKRVHQIMSHKPVTLPATAGIFEAIAIFNQHNISCIPVIDSEQHPIGVVSWRDILKMIENNWLKRQS